MGAPCIAFRKILRHVARLPSKQVINLLHLFFRQRAPLHEFGILLHLLNCAEAGNGDGPLTAR